VVIWAGESGNMLQEEIKKQFALKDTVIYSKLFIFNSRCQVPKRGKNPKSVI